MLDGDTTITLTGENTITISDTAYTAALDMYYRNLTIQGSGSLTVTVPTGKGGIEDGNWSDTAGGTLTIKDGVKITTNGGRNGLSAKTIVIEGGNLNLNSGCGIVHCIPDHERRNPLRHRKIWCVFEESAMERPETLTAA